MHLTMEERQRRRDEAWGEWERLRANLAERATLPASAPLPRQSAMTPLEWEAYCAEQDALNQLEDAAHWAPGSRTR